jgi:hypothetical protein
MMEFWTKVAAIAALGQVAVLIATAVFVWRYLQETTELRRAAQRQVALANEQLEAQMRPALVVRLYGDHILVNVGSGPALNLQVADVVWGGEMDWTVRTNIGNRLEGAFVAAEGPLAEKATAIPPDYFFMNPHRSLVLIYESLSGRVYATRVDFSRDGPVRTTFLTKQG